MQGWVGLEESKTQERRKLALCKGLVWKRWFLWDFCRSFLLLLPFCNLSAHSFSYRQTSFYCTSFHCASQILLFLQIEGLWQPCLDNSIHSLFLQKHLLISYLCVTFW